MSATTKLKDLASANSDWQVAIDELAAAVGKKPDEIAELTIADLEKQKDDVRDLLAKLFQPKTDVDEEKIRLQEFDKNMAITKAIQKILELAAKPDIKAKPTNPENKKPMTLAEAKSAFLSARGESADAEVFVIKIKERFGDTFFTDQQLQKLKDTYDPSGMKVSVLESVVYPILTEALAKHNPAFAAEVAIDSAKKKMGTLLNNLWNSQGIVTPTGVKNQIVSEFGTAIRGKLLEQCAWQAYLFASYGRRENYDLVMTIFEDALHRDSIAATPAATDLPSALANVDPFLEYLQYYPKPLRYEDIAESITKFFGPDRFATEKEMEAKFIFHAHECGRLKDGKHYDEIKKQLKTIFTPGEAVPLELRKPLKECLREITERLKKIDTRIIGEGDAMVNALRGSLLNVVSPAALLGLSLELQTIIHGRMSFDYSEHNWTMERIDAGLITLKKHLLDELKKAPKDHPLKTEIDECIAELEAQLTTAPKAPADPVTTPKTPPPPGKTLWQRFLDLFPSDKSLLEALPWSDEEKNVLNLAVEAVKVKDLESFLGSKKIISEFFVNTEKSYIRIRADVVKSFSIIVRYISTYNMWSGDAGTLKNVQSEVQRFLRLRQTCGCMESGGEVCDLFEDLDKPDEPPLTPAPATKIDAAHRALWPKDESELGTAAENFWQRIVAANENGEQFPQFLHEAFGPGFFVEEDIENIFHTYYQHREHKTLDRAKIDLMQFYQRALNRNKHRVDKEVDYRAIDDREYAKWPKNIHEAAALIVPLVTDITISSLNVDKAESLVLERFGEKFFNPSELRRFSLILIKLSKTTHKEHQEPFMVDAMALLWVAVGFRAAVEYWKLYTTDAVQTATAPDPKANANDADKTTQKKLDPDPGQSKPPGKSLAQLTAELEEELEQGNLSLEQKIEKVQQRAEQLEAENTGKTDLDLNRKLGATNRVLMKLKTAQTRRDRVQAAKSSVDATITLGSEALAIAGTTATLTYAGFTAPVILKGGFEAAYVLLPNTAIGATLGGLLGAGIGTVRAWWKGESKAKGALKGAAVGAGIGAGIGTAIEIASLPFTAAVVIPVAAVLGGAYFGIRSIEKIKAWFAGNKEEPKK